MPTLPEDGEWWPCLGLRSGTSPALVSRPFQTTPFMPFFRKVRTLQSIVAGCRNWPALVAAKLGCGDGGRIVRLRNGLEVEVKNSVMTDWGQVFEPAIADVYRIGSADADVIVDVGANFGSFSCLAAWTHRNGKVYAFEPQEDQAVQLRRNLERNHLQNVETIESPATADGRDVTFFEQANEGAANIFQSGDGKSIALKSVTLDCVKFSEGRSAFIKLDCEGAEGELIDWLVTHLDRLPARTTIACEYHPWCPVPIEQSIARLARAGFTLQNEMHFDEAYLFARRG